MLPPLHLPSLHALQRKCRAQKPLGRRADRPNILHRSVNVQEDSWTVLTPTKHHSNLTTRSQGSALPPPRGGSSGSQGGTSKGGQERSISLLQPPVNPPSERHPAEAAPSLWGGSRGRTAEQNSSGGYHWLCRWRGATTSLQVCCTKSHQSCQLFLTIPTNPVVC